VREGVEEKRKHRYFEAKLEMSSTPAEAAAEQPAEAH